VGQETYSLKIHGECRMENVVYGHILIIEQNLKMRK
jgi:hypothetical protein